MDLFVNMAQHIFLVRLLKKGNHLVKVKHDVRIDFKHKLFWVVGNNPTICSKYLNRGPSVDLCI
ncbi:unnamed protein product [Haemonchus placei]|uniref:Uncharacterized protein n=1 Tax=Haemonchus placei TaxID=6290 RepID=A0A3P7SR71_HAEPC|nr:unnamed protein product [Haemonchus placei]